MTEEREMTALTTSVGAEIGQSPNVTTDIISDYGENFNPSAEEITEFNFLKKKIRNPKF